MAIQIRRGTNSQWEGGNQNIVVGEPAITTDTGRFFVGTGTGTYQEFLKVADDGTIKTPKIITEDSQGDEYPLITDNGTELWIGGNSTSEPQHNGQTHISAGYNSSTRKGNPSAKVAVANPTNTGSSSYDIIINRISEKTYSDFSYESNATYYATSGNQTPTAIKTGRVVQLAGGFKIKTAIAAGASVVKIGSVPAGFEPKIVTRFIAQGSGINKLLIAIYDDGDIYVARYGTDAYAQIPVDAYIGIACTYISKTVEDGS